MKFDEMAYMLWNIIASCEGLGKSMKMKMDFMKRNSTYAYCWFKSPCDLGWPKMVKITRKRASRD